MGCSKDARGIHHWINSHMTSIDFSCPLEAVQQQNLGTTAFTLAHGPKVL